MHSKLGASKCVATSGKKYFYAIHHLDRKKRPLIITMRRGESDFFQSLRNLIPIVADRLKGKNAARLQL